MATSFPFSPQALGALFGIQTATEEEAPPIRERLGNGAYTVLDWTVLPVLRHVVGRPLAWVAGKAIQTDAVRNLQGRAQVWVRDHTLNQIKANAISQPQPMLTELLEALVALRDKKPVPLDSTGTYDEEDECEFFEATTGFYTEAETNRAVEAINLFLKNPELAFASARKPDGTIVKLEQQHLDHFTNLLNQLKKTGTYQEDLVTDLKAAIAFLEPLAESQKGWLTNLRSLGESINVGQFLAMLGLTQPDQEMNLQVDLETQRSERELLRRVTEQTAEIPPPVKPFETAISEKLDEITDLAIKMTLTRLIFNGRSKAIFVKIYNEALTKKSDVVSFDTTFFKALEDEFSTSNKDQSIVDRTLYWVHLKISLPFLRFYIGSMMARFKIDLLMFLKRSPEQRINDVFAIALKPLKAHMAAFYSYNRELSGKTATTSIDETNRKYFDALQLDEKVTMDSILFEFSSLLVERYAPTISWTQGIGNTLDGLQAKTAVSVPQWEAVQAIITATKVTLVWTSFLITGGFEWALNKGVKYLLRNELKKQIQTNFFKGENSEESAHSRYQYFINRFITGKLRHFNANGATSDQAPRKLRSSPTTQQEMQQVIDELFRSIPLSIATRSAETLGKYFSSDVLVQGKQSAYSFFIDQFTPTVSLEILKGLEHFLYDDKEQGKSMGLLSEFVWYTASNLTNVFTTEATPAEQTEMIATETDMHEQLRMTVKSVVKEGVATALDPSKKHQDTTNAIFADIRTQAEEFSLSIENQTESDLAVFDKEWKRLNEAIFAMIKETKIEKIVHVRNQLVIAFERATAALSLIIAQLMTLDKERKQLNERLEIITGLEGQIRTTTGPEKIAKLSILGEKTWVSTKTKEAIEVYKKYLNDYLRTRPSKQLMEQEAKNKTLFEAVLQKEKQILTDGIAEQTAAIEQQLLLAKAQKQTLEGWIAKLKPIALTTEDVTSPLTRVIKTLNLQGVVQDGAVTAVVQAVSELINFKEKPYHWNQVLIRAMHASNQHVSRTR